MAGKTFRGVGDDEDSSPRRPQDDAPQLVDEFDPHGLYSGPTVVDDQKVAEVLKKLRSLDGVPGPLTGVTQAVVDNATEPVRLDSTGARIDSGPAPAIDNRPTPVVMNSDPGPARLQDVMYPLQRATAIGRSMGTAPSDQQVTVPADLARGTLFGRSIHLPDVNAPESAEIELSSGAVHYLDGEPPSSQPFPLADGAPAPAGAAAPRAAPVAAGPAIPPLAAPVGPPVQRFRTPYEPNTETTLVDSTRRKVVRAIALLGGLAVAGGGWYAWTHLRPTWMRETPPEASVTTPAAAPTAPSIVPLEVTPAPTAAPAPTPAPAAEPEAPEPAAAAPATETPPPSAAPAAKAAPAADEPAPTARPTRTTRRSSRAERRAAARAAEPAAATAPSDTGEPSQSKRRAATLEDPDATLPPSD